MPLIKCPECGREVSDKATVCVNCGYPIANRFNGNNQYRNQSPNQYAPVKTQESFNGVYKYTLFGGKKEVYCPRCNSSNCSHYQEQKVIPGKTKTKYSANLNPLHPFTLVNKKEKVVRKEQTYTESKFICNSCGKIFY